MDNVGEFFDTVSSTVNNHVSASIEQFKVELRKIAEAKKVSNEYTNKLDSACEALLENTLTQFETNLNKFQLYTIRNIISNEQHQQQRKLQEKAAKLQKLDTHENQENQENHNNKQSIIIMKSDVLLDQQLSDLHHRYRYLQQELHQLQTEHYDIKQLITDMRSSVFSLRVAMQSFEEYDISPLSETTETMQQSYQKLQSYCQQAKGLLKKLGVQDIPEDHLSEANQSPSSMFMLQASNHQINSHGFKDASSIHIKTTMVENDMTSDNTDLFKDENDSDQFPVTDLHALAQISHHLNK